MDPIVVRREPKKRFTRPPLVVLLHGTGADERDLIGLADAFPEHVASASLRGPIALGDGGYVWFDRRGIAMPLARSLRERTTEVAAWVADLARDNGPIFLLGFSAGAMMAGALVLDEPQRYAGAILLSGAVAFDAGIATPAGRLAGLPIFHAHGTRDEVIPHALVERTTRYLRDESGAAYDGRSYPIAHGISPRECDDIGAWLANHT